MLRDCRRARHSAECIAWHGQAINRSIATCHRDQLHDWRLSKQQYGQRLSVTLGVSCQPRQYSGARKRSRLDDVYSGSTFNRKSSRSSVTQLSRSEP